MSSRSGMCDVAQKEFVHQLSEMGLQFREVQGDGNCLFRALGDQLEGNVKNHLYYRQETAKYMMTNRRDFEPFLEDDCSFEDYIRKLQKEGTYAGNDAIVAFARRFDVNVIIHQVCAPLWIIEGGCCHAPELHIAYYNGDHYASIRKFGDKEATPARVWLRDLKKFRKERRKRKPTESDIRKKVQHIMNVTECMDAQLVERLLEQHNFDVDQTIVDMTENNRCVGDVYDADIEKDCRYRGSTKKQRFSDSNKQPDCGASATEDCEILVRAATKRECYERGRSPSRRSSREGGPTRKGIIKPSRSRSRSSSRSRKSSREGRMGVSDESIGGPVTYGRATRAPNNCDMPVYTYTGHPRNQPTCNYTPSDENVALQGTYSDNSSAAGPTREAPRFKERGETREINTPPPSPVASKKKPKSPRSRSPASNKSPKISLSTDSNKSSRSLGKSKSREKPRSREVSPKPSRVKSDTTPKSSRKFADVSEDEDEETVSKSRVRDKVCEEPQCPLGYQDSSKYTVVKPDSSASQCGGPPCPQSDIRRGSLPIVCTTLSDAVMSSASSSGSLDQIDKASCALRSKRTSDTWLNITLGILVAFLVLCLIRLF